jgi:hypothetical protein
MLRRRKDEVLDLPPKIRNWIDVEIPDRAREALNDAVRSFLGDTRTEPERDARRYWPVVLNSAQAGRC